MTFEVNVAIKIFFIGDIIEVIGAFDDGWWSGKVNGKIGLFPKEYLFKENLKISLN